MVRSCSKPVGQPPSKNDFLIRYVRNHTTFTCRGKKYLCTGQLQKAEPFPQAREWPTRATFEDFAVLRKHFYGCSGLSRISLGLFSSSYSSYCDRSTLYSRRSVLRYLCKCVCACGRHGTISWRTNGRDQISDHLFWMENNSNVKSHQQAA